MQHVHCAHVVPDSLHRAADIAKLVRIYLVLSEHRVVGGNHNVSALRRFKRKVQQEAIIKEIKKHSVYFKPGEKKRMKEAQARKRMRRRMKREKDLEY